MATRIFKRNVAITIAKPLGFFVTSPNAVVVRDLRVVFQIQKSLSKDPNTCEISIFNLAERTRGEVQAKPLHVRVDAGYDGNLERLFTGDLRFAQSKRQPVDWETVLQVADGDRAIRHARVNKSYKAGVNVKQALSDIAKSMGLKMPHSVDDAKELATSFVSGLALQGPSQAEMERLLKPRGYSHSIQDGQLQILKSTTAQTGIATIIAQDTGMVGSPEFGTPDKKSGKPTLTVKTLLKPSVSPGGLIKVESDAVSGVFRVERVTHSGDTHGQDWYTTIESKEYK